VCGECAGCLWARERYAMSALRCFITSKARALFSPSKLKVRKAKRKEIYSLLRAFALWLATLYSISECTPNNGSAMHHSIMNCMRCASLLDMNSDRPSFRCPEPGARCPHG